MSSSSSSDASRPRAGPSHGRSGPRSSWWSRRDCPRGAGGARSSSSRCRSRRPASSYSSTSITTVVRPACATRARASTEPLVAAPTRWSVRSAVAIQSGCATVAARPPPITSTRIASAPARTAPSVAHSSGTTGSQARLVRSCDVPSCSNAQSEVAEKVAVGRVGGRHERPMLAARRRCRSASSSQRQGGARGPWDRRGRTRCACTRCRGRRTPSRGPGTRARRRRRNLRRGRGRGVGTIGAHCPSSPLRPRHTTYSSPSISTATTAPRANIPGSRCSRLAVTSFPGTRRELGAGPR